MITILGCVYLLGWFCLFGGTALAQPFGVGRFGAIVPFGGATYISLSTFGTVNISITPSGSGTLGTGQDFVGGTSTDVVGFKLYIRALSSTDLVNGSSTIPASSNAVPGSLSINTWGYNTDWSNTTTFTGMTGSDTLISNYNGPADSGFSYYFTYGVYIDNSKPAGSYSTTVLYTVLPQTY